jgi:hypothetical protein
VLLKAGNVGHPAERSIVKHHNLMILGEVEVKLDEIALVEGSLYAGERVFREQTTITSVSDDQRFVRHNGSIMRLIVKWENINQWLSIYISVLMVGQT